MPRVYKPKPGVRQLVHHDKVMLAQAAEAITKGMSYREAEKKFKIPKSVLQRRITKPDMKDLGGQIALGADLEKVMVGKLITCGEWGYPMTGSDLRLMVKDYLDRHGIKHRKFKNNMPGNEWTKSFLRRHKYELLQRMGQNIKSTQAANSLEPVDIQSESDKEAESSKGLVASTAPDSFFEMSDSNVNREHKEIPSEMADGKANSNKIPEGVIEVSKESISQNMWLIVDFSVLNSRQKTRKRSLYIGQVQQILGSGSFEGIFLRETFRGDGTTYSFPVKEDRSLFDYSQVIGVVCDPEEMRRGILKFSVNLSTFD